MKINNHNIGVVILSSIIVFWILLVTTNYLISVYHISASDVIQFIREYADVISAAIVIAVMCYSFYRLGKFLDN